MKLYPILFNENVVNKSPSRFTAPEYGLVVAMAGSWGATLVLVHVPTCKQMLKDKLFDEDTVNIEDWCCAYVDTDNIHSDDCSRAVEINYMVASPKHPGAGAALYGLISKYYGRPITSDRGSSTSDQAKVAWARIENSPGEWKKVELDNYTDIPDGKGRSAETYFDAVGSWPNRKIDQLDGPKTPETTDDCKLPETDTGSTREIDRKTGTFNAWKYVGPLDQAELIVAANKMMEDIEQETGMEIVHQKKAIRKGGEHLFVDRYKG